MLRQFAIAIFGALSLLVPGKKAATVLVSGSGRSKRDRTQKHANERK